MSESVAPVASTTTVEPVSPKVLYKKHPLAIRWFHWINFPVLFIMVWSGLMIYWANDVFTVHLPFSKQPLMLFKDPTAASGRSPNLFPESWFAPKAPSWMFAKGTPTWIPNFFTTPSQDDDGNTVHNLWSMSGRLADGMAWHFLFAWFFVVNGLLYTIYLAASREWRLILPKPAALKESIHVVLFDLKLSKKPLPIRKYNAAQQIAYTGVIVMGALMLLTGISIYKPAQQGWLTALFGGYSIARFIHFWVTMGFLGFFVVHVGQVVKTGWNNFRGMITGHELVSPSEKVVLEEQRL